MRTRIACAWLSALAALALPLAVAPAAQAAVTRVFLMSPATNRCLETDSGFTGVDSCNWSAIQKWDLTSSRDGYVTVKNVATGECLAHFERGSDDVLAVQCKDDASQRWTEDNSLGPARQRFSTAGVSGIVVCLAVNGDAAVVAHCEDPATLWQTQQAG